jgi:hypothetical protein
MIQYCVSPTTLVVTIKVLQLFKNRLNGFHYTLIPLYPTAEAMGQ